MGVGRVPRAHLLDGVGEQARAVEDVGVLGEEAEDQPRHEVVHVVAALGRAPVGVVLQQLDIEPVQAAGGPDVEGVLADLLDGGDAGQRQEEAEMVGKVLVGAGDGLAARQVLGLEIHAVGRQDELRLRFGGRGARLQRRQRLRDLSRVARRRCGCCWSEERRRGRTCSTRPARSRLIVVSLLPKASRKANGKFSGSNGCSASCEMASSISTAFNCSPLPT